MARIITGGVPATLVLDQDDLQDVDASADQGQALIDLLAAHGLPAHAPVAAENGGSWLNGWAIFVRGRRLPREGGWEVVRRYAHGLRTAKHSTIG